MRNSTIPSRLIVERREEHREDQEWCAQEVHGGYSGGAGAWGMEGNVDVDGGLL